MRRAACASCPDDVRGDIVDELGRKHRGEAYEATRAPRAASVRTTRWATLTPTGFASAELKVTE